VGRKKRVCVDEASFSHDLWWYTETTLSPLPACLSVVRRTQKEGSAVSGWLLAHIVPSD